MINTTTLTGRLTKDVELRTTGSGINVVNFTLAVDRTFSNAQGEKETDFIRCVAWRKTAELMDTYLHKGSLIGVEGRIQTGSYEDTDGKTVFTTDVVAENVIFLESKKEAQANRQSQSTPFTATKTDENPFANQDFTASDATDISDDDLPF